MKEGVYLDIKGNLWVYQLTDAVWPDLFFDEDDACDINEKSAGLFLGTMEYLGEL